MSLWTLDSGTVTLDSGVFTWDGFAPDVVVTPQVQPSAGGARLWGPIDWSRIDKLKKKAKKKSKEAVEIVEDLVAKQESLTAALELLTLELHAAHVKAAEIYCDLLKLEFERKRHDEDLDDEDVIFLTLH